MPPPGFPLYYGAARGDYYGESGSSFMIREIGDYDDLQEIVKLTARGLPERPDGIVCVVKFTSSVREECVRSEAEYERMARENAATCFLRCFEEFEGSDQLFGQAKVTALPCFDLFYGGKRVARVEGSDHPQLEELLDMYQFQNTNLDLFSEDADNKRRLKWGDGKLPDYNKTPRTTNRFIPGYDWDKDKGFFDDLGDKFEDEWDKMYGEWVPEVQEE